MIYLFSTSRNRPKTGTHLELSTKFHFSTRKCWNGNRLPGSKSLISGNIKQLSVRPPSARPAHPLSRTREAAAPSRGRTACCRSPPSPPGPTGRPPCRRPTPSSARPTGTSRGGGRASPAGPPRGAPGSPRASRASRTAMPSSPRTASRAGVASWRDTQARGAPGRGPGGRRPWRAFPRPRPPGPGPCASSVGRPRSATSQSSSPRSPPRRPRTPRGPTCRARARRRRASRPPGQHRRRPGPPAGRRLAGARAADLAGDGRPLPGGAGARPTAPLGPVRTSRDVPGHTPQAPAHSLSVPPAHACPARPAQTSPSGSGHPSGPMALREGARPQDPRDRPCDPSPSCPSRARRVPPHLGHAC